MHTPAHAIFNLLFLGRKRPALGAPILIGAVLPDLPMVFFYFWEKHVLGRSENWIWSKGYHDPGWQSGFDLFNSIPLLSGALLVARWRRSTAWQALFLSMILHCLTDLPVHVGDAHRHFYPFSNWRFRSWVSYWNPSAFGREFATLEMIFVVAGCLLVMITWEPPWIRAVAALILLIYACFLVFAVSMWH